jgi:hypothetical protein
MLDELGEELWVACDTDGAVLDLTRARSWLRERSWPLGRVRSPLRIAEAVCEAVSHLTWPLVPRVKLMSETLHVSGPQHYSGDTFERAAGRPGKPEVEADGHLRWWSWPGVKWQMAHGSTEGFVRVEQSWTSPSQLAHRWVLTDGRAVPVLADTCAPSGDQLLGWPLMGATESTARLHPDQAPALAGLH